MKPRMTKQRKEVLDRLAHDRLAFTNTERGGREYFFVTGKKVSQSVVDGMLAIGLLKIADDGLFSGFGQTIIASEV